MKTEPVRSLTEKMLPPGASPKYLRALRQKKTSRPASAWHALSVMVSAYCRHAVEAANKWAIAGTILLLVLGFGTSSMKLGSAALLASALIAVVWGDARLHKTAPPEGADPLLHYAGRSGADAATALLLGLVSNAMVLEVAPSGAVPLVELWSGGVICIPLLFILRMYFNLKRIPEKPSGGHKSPAELEKMYKHVWWLGVLWMISFMGVTACTVTDIPNYWPDKVKGYSIVLFGIWLLLQRDCLGRFDRIRTIFRDPVKLELRRKYSSLAKGLRRGEAFYPGYIAMEIGIHGVIALLLYDALLPWRTGHFTPQSFVQAAASMMASGVAVLTWQVIKKSNRLAAQAIREAMKGN